MKHKRFKLFLVYYFFYCLFVIGAGIFFASILNVDFFEPEVPELGDDFRNLVLTHNLRNFALYLLGFIISPLLQMLDLGGSAFQITLGFRIFGAEEGLNRLIPHGLLEFPNMLLYMGISQYLLWTLIFTRSIRTTLEVIKKLIPVYILSLAILIIAAIIEGYI